MAQPIIFGSVFAYTALLFAIAYWADRNRRLHGALNRNAIVYGLSIAVYCTSWTFYGAVGTAEARGWEYAAIYLGPALVFSFGLPLLSRMVEIGKRIHSTSIADFISAHYGKSRGLAAFITLIAVVGALPYIALQLKSVATTFAYLAPNTSTEVNANGVALVAAALAAFAIIFGTRHIDITRHNNGMIAAIAFDSIFKLVALIAVGVFAILVTPALDANTAAPPPYPAFSEPLDIDRFVTLTLLASAAILCLPRQFHVMVVECRDPKALRPASSIFLIYLAIITALVIPIGHAGLLSPMLSGVSPDLYVLALPLAHGAQALALLVFVGGFAAATGMVIVASVALSTMITNDLIAPFLLRDASMAGPRPGFGARLLTIRRISICSLLFIAAIVAIYAPQSDELAALGILSFAAVAQFMPALIGALYWKKATLGGAASGMAVGFALWVFCLFSPSYLNADGLTLSAPLAWLDFTNWDELTRGVVVSLGANISLFIGVSLIRSHIRPTIGEFAASALGKIDQSSSDRILAGDLYMLIQRCLGELPARNAIAKFETTRGLTYDPTRIADPTLIEFADRQISKAIGASSASILMRSVLAGGSLELDDVATLLGETTGKVSFSRELLQTTLENISPGVSVVDTDLNLVAWNAAYVEMYDYPPEFIQEGRPIADLIRYNALRGECGPGEIDEHVARRLEHLRAGRRHFFERTRPNGSVVKIEGIRSPSGAYVTTYTDVTEYKRIQRALFDSERSIRFYTDNIPAMVSFSNADETIQFANSAYRRTFSITENDIETARFSDILSPRDYAARKPHIEKALRGEKTIFDIDVTTLDGLAHMQVTYVPQFRADGAVRGFFALYQDVTARRKAEQALAETNETLEERVGERTKELSLLNEALDTARRDAEEATASKTRFLAAASHDVLQPLNAARLFTSALKDEMLAQQDACELCDKIDASIASADRLLRSLLNISKLDAGGIKPEKTTFAVSEIFRELSNDFAIAAHKKGVAFRCVDTSLWIKSDRGLLLSALQNLVSNAVRYTDAGKILLGAQRFGDKVRIAVYDTGRGIPPTERNAIFQEFKRLDRDADKSGAGLGLATVDRIAKLLELEVNVQSTERKGSMFALTTQRAAARTAPIVAKPAQGPLVNLSAICIDNDAAVLDAMTAALTRWGAKVHSFPSDDDAITKLGPNLAAPELLLLDYQLNHNRTGFDALERLENIWGIRPITIMITASSSQEAEEKSAALGIPILQKPVEPAQLRALITQLRQTQSQK